jgi:hypothetical protein
MTLRNPVPELVVLELEVNLDLPNQEVYLTHPSLKGELRLRYSSLDLAAIQLNALRLDKPKTALESTLDDTTQLIGLIGELRTAISGLNKAH